MTIATTLLELERTVSVRYRPALSDELFPARSDVSSERLRETTAQLVGRDPATSRSRVALAMAASTESSSSPSTSWRRPACVPWCA